MPGPVSQTLKKEFYPLDSKFSVLTLVNIKCIYIYIYITKVKLNIEILQW